MKIVKCTELDSMWDYRKKQKQKIFLLESFQRPASPKMQMGVIQDGTAPGHVGRAQSIEMSECVATTSEAAP